MQSYPSRLRLKFRFLTSFYDLFDLAFAPAPERNPRRVLAGKIPNEPLRILDVCVGTAQSSIGIAQANDRNEIVGIDLSPHMIALAREKIRSRGIRNLSIHEMDARRMSFPDGQFDIAMVSFGLHEMDYGLMVDVLGEMHRVLKEGGRLYIVDYHRGDGRIERWILSVFLKLFEPSHMGQFLKYDWTRILQDMGFRLDGTERLLFSKLICAARQGNHIGGSIPLS